MKLSDGTPVSPRLRWAGKEKLIAVRDMTTSHILHAKEYVDRRAIAEDYDGSEPYRGYSYGEWSEIFALELERRDVDRRTRMRRWLYSLNPCPPLQLFFEEFDGDVPVEAMW